MERENLKVISVRLEPQVINAIDEFVRKHKYWKRNTVINSILCSVMRDFKEKDIYDMSRRNAFRNQEIEAKYTIIRQ